MSDNSFDAAQKALRNRAVVDLEEPLPDEQPTRWWLRIVVLLVFFGFGAIVWVSWQDNAGDGIPVLVEAPPGPVKEKPLDEGGMTPRNEGTEITSVLGDGQTAGSADPLPKVGPAPSSEPPARPQVGMEELIPPVEDMGGIAGAEASGPGSSTGGEGLVAGTQTATAPEAGQSVVAARPRAADGNAALPSAVPSWMAEAPSDAALPTPVVPAVPATAPLVDTTPVVPPSSSAALQSPAADPAPVDPLPPEPAAPEPAAPEPAAPEPAAPEPAAPEPAAPEPAAPEPAAAPPAPAPAAPEPVVEPVPAAAPPAAASGVRVQVASLRDEAAAKVAWDQVAKKNPEVFAGKRPVIVAAEVKGATYYRAQIDGFASKDEAQAACAKLKSNGSDCLVLGR